jgi:SAM-dependent methyltransferase
MDHETPLQVDAKFYSFAEYVNFRRWCSYWHQIDAVLRGRPSSVLEIGPGFGTTTQALRRAGVQVTTFDFDPELKPDLVGDARALNTLVAPGSFDAICAFQVLEHIPFEDFDGIVANLALASRDKVIISLPHWGYPVEFRFRFLKDVISRAISFKVTRPKTWTFDGQHYWELGTRGYAIKDVAKVIDRHLKIDRQYFCPDYSYHYFFECSVRRD